MRALLINPWIYDFKAFDFWNKPLGLIIIARMLKQYGFAVDLIDCMDRRSPLFTTTTKTDMFGRGKYHYEIVNRPLIFHSVPRHYKRYGISKNAFVHALGNINPPDVIFVTSAMTYWYLGVFEAIRILKQHFPGTPVVLGGIYATLCEKHARTHAGADMVITGPIEKKLFPVLQTLNLFVRKDSEQEYYVPDFSLYHQLHYGVILTSRGCPFACTYCATKVLCPVFAALPNSAAVEQLDYFSKRTKDIAFFDDALLYNTSFPDLLREIQRKEYNMRLHASNGLHCRYIDSTIAQLMFNAHFATVYLSLETTNPLTQQQTGGKVTTSEFMMAVKTLRAAGFSAHAIHTYILYGMPGQSHEEILDAINLCHELNVHPHLCEFSPIPKTEEFTKTGFTEDTDPLYHNNLFYTWFYPEPKPEIYRTIKRLLSEKSYYLGN